MYIITFGIIMNKNRKASIIKFVSFFAKLMALSISLLLLIFFIGESTKLSLQLLSFQSIWLLFFLPGLYTIGAFYSVNRENCGSIIMIISIIGFNIFSYIFEKRIQDFDFLIFLIPAFMLIIVNLMKTKK